MTETLFILGMHRSGTSCIARCLEEMGTTFSIPKCADGYYPKHIEYYQINQLNDTIITNWKKPLVNNKFARKKFYEWKVGHFIRKNFPTPPILGIKDPRFLLTFSYWAKHITNHKIIAIYRRPEEVASSLEIRDEYGKASFLDGLELWKIYNEQLIALNNLYDFPILDFNSTKTNFGQCLAEACMRLRLPFNSDTFNKVFIEKKRHHHSTNIPNKYKEIYKTLKAKTVNAHSTECHD